MSRFRFALRVKCYTDIYSVGDDSFCSLGHKHSCVLMVVFIWDYQGFVQILEIAAVAEITEQSQCIQRVCATPLRQG